MADTATYTGDVCYQDGWHMSIVDGNPGVRLYLNDYGSYREAADGDLSWHDRHHQRFASFVVSDGEPALQVSADELAEIRKLLDERRGG